MNSTKIAILFLDTDLCVRRFTPETTKLIYLVDHDIGRPITHIVHNLDLEDLARKAQDVIETLAGVQEEV